MIDNATYKRAPITEAIINFQFAKKVEKNSIERAAEKLKRHYVQRDEEHFFEVQIGIDNPSERITRWNGLRLSSADRADVVALRVDQFGISRLAPYDGWLAFTDRAHSAWQVAEKAGATSQINRIGVRYMNRIDIPSKPGQVVQLEDYLVATMRLPNFDWGPILNYAMTVSRPLKDSKYNMNLNAGTTLSPLLNHLSLILDIDVYRAEDLPAKIDEIWKLVDEMRGIKNRLFEAFITDRSRALFNS